MKNFLSFFFVILFIPALIFFNSPLTGYRLKNHPGNNNIFFTGKEKTAFVAADFLMTGFYKQSINSPGKNKPVTKQPIAYSFIISYNNFNKQKAFTGEKFFEKYF